VFVIAVVAVVVKDLILIMLGISIKQRFEVTEALKQFCFRQGSSH
jgi:hypothetical protein